jgi:hypothetical protein
MTIQNVTGIGTHDEMPASWPTCIGWIQNSCISWSIRTRAYFGTPDGKYLQLTVGMVTQGE